MILHHVPSTARIRVLLPGPEPRARVWYPALGLRPDVVHALTAPDRWRVGPVVRSAILSPEGATCQLVRGHELVSIPETAARPMTDRGCDAVAGRVPPLPARNGDQLS
jgi:hypothetical protein